MGLWGKSTSADSRPKFLKGDGAEGAGGKKEDVLATTRGWELKAGTAASGNDNASADSEVLVAIGGLSSALGAANLMSVDWTDGTYAHDGSADFDIVFTYDEAVTVTSAAATANNTISNKIHTSMHILGPTDMAKDADMKMQYQSGSGTNRLVFRGRIPADGVAGGYIAIADATAAMATDGSSAMVDGNGTTVPSADADHAGGSAAAGADGSSAIWGTAITRTGSSDNTLRTVAGSSSGTSSLVLTGVVLG
jgi:hypothetical protein|tara:strand:+ start:379 stop:1131 length:753 start_codon:yes stop_codon:yes gene_type:complete